MILNVTQGSVKNSINYNSLSSKESEKDTDIQSKLDPITTETITANQTQSILEPFEVISRINWQQTLLIVSIIVLFLLYQRKITSIASDKQMPPIKESDNKLLLKTTLQEAISACETGNAELTAAFILKWAKLAWPEPGPVSLLDVAENIQVGDKNIRRLHYYLYQPSSQGKQWKDTELLKMLSHGLKPKAAFKIITNKQYLPPLCPA